ncbi:MAG: TonB C-terminal domain-containing protein [Gallionella sp.]
MNAAAYHEPHKVPAGVLALVVHSLFFALLYFGFNWNRQAYSNPTMSVELWPGLPEEAAAPPANPKIAQVVQPMPQPQPEKIAKPDIAMPEKKTETKPVETKLEKKESAQRAIEAARIKAAAQKAAEQKQEAQRIADAQAAQQKAELAKQAEQAAATGRIVDEYKAKIQEAIRRNIVALPGVPQNANTTFMVTLLPGGWLLKSELEKSSGYEAYDQAVERAIRKSDPLPVPPDPSLFSKFRELHMKFQLGNDK